LIVEKGYAKINLVLEVVGKRDDGFHDLAMVSTTIDLYDELYFTPINENRIIIECDALDNIPKESNLIYQAAKLLQDKFNIKTGFKVRVIKKIPMGAGLAGGSADAAATLRALNAMWNLGLSLDELAQIGLQIGSDVPFCVYNKDYRTAIIRGRGEKLEFIEDVPFGYVVMIHPNFSASTKHVFTNHHQPLGNKGFVEKMKRAVEVSDLSLVASYLHNDLEITVDQVYKQKDFKPILFMKSELIKCGVMNAVMTGSGSTVYGLALNLKQANKIKNTFIAKHKELFTSIGYSSSSYNIFVYSIRSNRKSIKSNIQIDEPQETTIEQTKTIPSLTKYNIIHELYSKAYGRALISLTSNSKYYELIEAPLNAYDKITIQIVDKPIVKVFINNKEENKNFYNEIKEAIQKSNFPDGYIVKIDTLINPNLKIIKPSIYVASIIRKLSEYYRLDEEKLFTNLHPRIKCYQYEKLYEYNSNTKSVNFLSNIPYSYIVIVPLINKKLNTKQCFEEVINNLEEYNNVKNGLSVSDYFLITANITNNLDYPFLKRLKKTSFYKRFKKILEQIRKVKARNYIFSNDGTTVIVFFKNERKANDLIHRLRKEYIYGAEKFSFKSNVSHRSSLSAFEISVEDLETTLTTASTNDSNENVDTPDLIDEGFTEAISFYDTNIEKVVINEELEGLFHIASPGSIFKQYDFIDLTQFFYRYFHNKKIYLEINKKNIPIIFNINCLPHIFGLHLIDRDNPEYRGNLGVKKLLSGDISYDYLKKLRNSNKITNETFDEIIDKTQSAFMVLKDLYLNRLDNILCFNKDSVTKPTSKMYNLQYAIARKKAINHQRDFHLIGIGFNEQLNTYFFYTSFLWKPTKTITKQDFLDIKVKKEQ